jgi:hypothetical protein
MSNIEDNAFKIAKYLLENPHKNEQLEIRDSLDFLDDDFRLALKFLTDGEFCKTAGQIGKGIIWQKNLAKLQDFVNRIGEKRISLSTDAERLLKLFFDSQTPASDSEKTIAALGWDEKRYLNALETLQFRKYIAVDYYDNKPFDIWITSSGREIVKNNFRSLFQEKSGVYIDVGGSNNIVNTGNSNTVNIDSTLMSIQQSVQANNYITQPAKQELDALLDELKEALKSVPDENRDDAEAVAEMAGDFVGKATKEKPNKPLIKISADGLIRAAETIAAITPKVLIASQAIIMFIKTQFPSLLP